MASGIKVEGLAELEAVLKAKAAEMHAAAVEAVAVEVEATGADAQSNAPVRTGELRGSIERESAELNGTVRATSRHAKFVELGTYKDPAQPFMKPAADRTRTRAPKTFIAIIRKALGA